MFLCFLCHDLVLAVHVFCGDCIRVFCIASCMIHTLTLATVRQASFAEVRLGCE